MEKQIITDGEGKEFIMKAFRCSRMQVWKALHYRSESDMARRIRILALQRGGVLVGDSTSECETTFEELAQTMTQTWGDRVKMVYNRNNNEAKIYVDGSIHRAERPGSISEFIGLQQEAERLVQAL